MKKIKQFAYSITDYLSDKFFGINSSILTVLAMIAISFWLTALLTIMLLSSF